MNKSDKYIKIAKKYDLEKTPFSIEEVRTLIENGGESANRFNSKNSKGTIKMTAFSAGALALLVGGYMYFAPQNNDVGASAPAIQDKNANIALNEKLLDNSSYLPSRKMSVSKNSGKAVDKNIDEDSAFFENLLVKINDSSDILSKARAIDRGSTPILVLTKEELKNIGVDYQDSTISFTYLQDISQIDGLERRQLMAKGYTKNSTASFKVFYNGKQMKDELIDYSISKGIPIKTAPFAVKYYEFTKHGSSIGSRFAMSPYLTKLGVGKMLCDEIDEMCKSIINFQIEFSDEDMPKYAGLEYPKTPFPLADKVLPILVKLKSSETISYMVLWFFPSKELMGMLPEDYREVVKDNINAIAEINATEIDLAKHQDEIRSYTEKTEINREISARNADLANLSEPDPEPQKKHEAEVAPLEGVRRLELSDEELAKIGIKKRNGLFTFPIENRISLSSEMKKQAGGIISQMKYDTSRASLMVRTLYIIDSAESRSEPVSYDGWDQERGDLTLPFSFSQYAHKFSIDKDGDFNHYNYSMENNCGDSPILEQIPLSQDLFAKDSSSGLTKPLISRLIPVHLKVGLRESADSSKIKYSDVFVWYYASKDFVALLPDRYRISLEKELELSAELEQGIIEQSDVCMALKGESYFGLCKLGDGNIESASAYPNPASQKFKLKIKMKSAAKASVKAYNSIGEYKSSLIENANFSAGDNEIEIDSKLNAGVYLLQIEDEKGGKSILNIVIR